MKSIRKTIEYGLYFLAFILPWQTRWIIRAGSLNGGAWEYGTISLYATDIVLILLLSFFCLFKIFNNKVNPPTPFAKGGITWWLIGGLEMFIFISMFFAPDKTVAVFSYLRFLLGVGLFWLIMKADYNKFKLIISLIAGIFLQAVLGIGQFAAQGVAASKWLGMAAHSASDLGTSVVETGAGERWLRAYGALDHPNMLGGLLAIGIILSVYLVLNNKKLNYELRITNYGVEYVIFYFLILTFVTALFFTFSRAAWLAAAVGVLLILIMAVIKNDWLAQKKMLKIILFSGILIFILTSVFQSLTMARTTGTGRLETKSNSERLESYKIAGQIIKKHWLFGTGIGNYTLAVHDEVNSNLPGYAYQPVHDVFLLILAEIGIFGFLFFVGLLIYGLIFNLKFEIFNECLNFKLKISQGFSDRKNFEYAKIGLLASFFVIFLFDHWFWSLHFGILLFWLVMGVIYRMGDTKLEN